ncbi:uncharacterized protein LOC133860253 [Alnus glutinosa]|uniref:uncharacterized protein LOC133860253 n=1 Tax=Alnus glutinosa TaxID=3517 RepID=UPI002D78DDD4|nr:uncharacterized protein LOC133860253 [Alnus glutinosa]
MKKPGFFAASVAAASATAISTCSSSSNSIYNTHQSSALFGSLEIEEAELKQSQENQRPSSTEKFAPRFDGLRFIETLVTAHR